MLCLLTRGAFHGLISRPVWRRLCLPLSIKKICIWGFIIKIKGSSLKRVGRVCLEREQKGKIKGIMRDTELIQEALETAVAGDIIRF